MAQLLVILNALVPVAFVILLGVWAGRAGFIKPESSGVLAILVLDFTLPIQIFNATATMSTEQLPGWQYFLAMALGLISVYLIALVISLTMFRKPIDASSLQALNSSFPNMAFIGIPVLTALLGNSAIIAVVVGLLISSLLLPPITLTLLAAGSPSQKGHETGAVVWSSILGALKQPLVWAPVLGVAVLAAHIPLPEVAQKSFTLIGQATSGVALFALGLLLSGHKLRVGFPAILNVVVKLLAQPAAMWLFAVLLGVTGVLRREMILLGALPTASFTAMFAIQYNVYTDESDATILLSTALSFLTLGVLIAITG